MAIGRVIRTAAGKAARGVGRTLKKGAENYRDAHRPPSSRFEDIGMVTPGFMYAPFAGSVAIHAKRKKMGLEKAGEYGRSAAGKVGEEGSAQRRKRGTIRTSKAFKKHE